MSSSMKTVPYDIFQAGHVDDRVTGYARMAPTPRRDPPDGPDKRATYFKSEAYRRFQAMTEERAARDFRSRAAVRVRKRVADILASLPNERQWPNRQAIEIAEPQHPIDRAWIGIAQAQF